MLVRKKDQLMLRFVTRKTVLPKHCVDSTIHQQKNSSTLKKKQQSCFEETKFIIKTAVLHLKRLNLVKSNTVRTAKKSFCILKTPKFSSKTDVLHYKGKTPISPDVLVHKDKITSTTAARTVL